MSIDLRTLSLPVRRNNELAAKYTCTRQASLFLQRKESAEGIIIGRRLQ